MSLQTWVMWSCFTVSFPRSRRRRSDRSWLACSFHASWASFRFCWTRRSSSPWSEGRGRTGFWSRCPSRSRCEESAVGRDAFQTLQSCQSSARGSCSRWACGKSRIRSCRSSDEQVSFWTRSWGHEASQRHRFWYLQKVHVAGFQRPQPWQHPGQ